MNKPNWKPSDDPAVNERRRKAREYCKRNREQRRKLNNDWIKNNPDRYKASKHRYRLKVKYAVLAMYANPVKCQKCGFKQIDALCLDHIENNGRAHREKLKLSFRGSTQAGSRIYEHIYHHGKEDGLQVLCANCNTIKQLRHLRYKSVRDKTILRQIESMYGNKITSKRLESERLSKTSLGLPF